MPAASFWCDEQAFSLCGPWCRLQPYQPGACDHAGSDRSWRRCGDPAGGGAVRSRHQGRDHRRRRRAGHAGRQRCGASHRRGGQDRHARRHRPARAHAASLHGAGRHHPLHAGARQGRHGRALWRHHHADRLCLRDGGQERASCDRGARCRLRAEELLRLGLPFDALERAAAHAVRRAGRGHPGRLSDHKNLHHQHLAPPHRAA